MVNTMPRVSTGYDGLIICYCGLGLKRVILCFYSISAEGRIHGGYVTGP